MGFGLGFGYRGTVRFWLLIFNFLFDLKFRYVVSEALCSRLDFDPHTQNMLMSSYYALP